MLKVWDDEHGHCIATLVGHTQEVVGAATHAVYCDMQCQDSLLCVQVCVHCEVELIASGSSDSSVRIWNYAGTVKYSRLFFHCRVHSSIPRLWNKIRVLSHCYIVINIPESNLAVAPLSVHNVICLSVSDC